MEEVSVEKATTIRVDENFLVKLERFSFENEKELAVDVTIYRIQKVDTSSNEYPLDMVADLSELTKSELAKIEAAINTVVEKTLKALED